MAVKVAINGFGRIGRLVFRAMIEKGLVGNDVEVVAVGDIVPADNLAYLLKYDSTQGRFTGQVSSKKSSADKPEDDVLVVNGKDIRVVSAKDPSGLPWKDLGVTLVIEATGLFTDAQKAKGHLDAGAKKVIITAPSEGEDITLVLGVNEDKYDPKTHHVVSNASCTTNGLAPAVKVAHDKFKIKRGLMTTIHAYTNDQKILDMPHSDLRRARAAAMSIIPTSTGAAKALKLVIPDMAGKLDGYALRVPISTVSIIDLAVEFETATTTEELREAYREAAKLPRFKGILQAVEEPLVSIDYKGDSHSSSVDLPLTLMLGKEKGTFGKIVAWYDNEWGYSVRTADLAAMMAKSL
jgi:glyceraldehyde 3-phosphate dehydrogenase